MNEDLDREELRDAARMLLLRPMLRSGGPDARIAAIIRQPRNQRVLQQWFERNFGWKLIVDRDVVRLQKIPAMKAAHLDDAPGQRVCVLYCLSLAVLDECGDQTVITEIGQRVTELSRARPGIPYYDQDLFHERRALVAAVRLLGKHGALVPTRGAAATEQDESAYLHRSGDAIYDVDHRVASLLLVSPVPPSRAGSPAGLTRELVADTDDGRNRHRRHQLMRRLVDEPVMHFDEIDEDMHAYFKNQRHLLVSELDEMLQVRVEVRAEGAALVDEELTDLRFPYDRTPQFAALLLAGALAETADPVARWVGDSELAALSVGISAEIAKRVKTIESHEITPATVLETGLRVLSGFRLIKVVPGGVFLRPALGRFRAVPEPAPPRGQGAASEPLFEEENG